MQSSSEQPLVGEEYSVTTLITAAKETNEDEDQVQLLLIVRMLKSVTVMA